MILILAVLVGMIPVVPAVIIFLRERDKVPTAATRNLIFGINGFNAVLGLMAAGIALVWLFSPPAALAAGSPNPESRENSCHRFRGKLGDMALAQAHVLQALTAVKDPDLHKDIVKLGFVKDVSIDGGRVSFTIELNASVPRQGTDERAGPRGGDAAAWHDRTSTSP